MEHLDLIYDLHVEREGGRREGGREGGRDGGRENY